MSWAAATVGQSDAASLTLVPELAELVRLSAWVDDAGKRLELSMQRLYAVQLCLEELVANIVLHGRPSGAKNLSIQVDLCPVAGGLEVHVDDSGWAFDPTLAMAPAPAQSLDDAPVGGLGLVLVRRFARSIAYRRDGDWNRVKLFFAG
jgi:anti-sigma regulatory factor (Ser/Thr protein kinase)